jgi:aconitase B
MLIYSQLTDGKGVVLPGKTISEQTIHRFEDFNKIMAKHKKDKKAARKELEKYRDTYWFYGLYYYKPDE